MVKGQPLSTRNLCRSMLKVPKEELLALAADHESYYSPYVQKKRTKNRVKERQIEPSAGYLKKVQRKIDKQILKPALTSLPDEIMGGRSGYSVIMNAKYHQSSEALMKYDVEQFFPSITAKQIYTIFRYRLNFCEEAANLLTFLTTYKEHVPQGAPTSTSLAILALENTCLKLKHYCDSKNLKFTVWVDDITISGPVKDLRASRYDLNRILTKSPYRISPEKDTGILKKGSRVPRSVTGIIVDNHGRLTIGKKKLHKIKQRVYGNRTDESTRGKLLFLSLVNRKQAAKLMHQFKINSKE